MAIHQKLRESLPLSVMDSDVARRVVNQHNIDCLSDGNASRYCEKGLTICAYRGIGYSSLPTQEINCDRCQHREQMSRHSETAFIGFTKQI